MSTEVEYKLNVTEIGVLEGHKDWVTAIETGHPQKENEDLQVLISASRDRTILIWKFNLDSKIASDFGTPVKCLTGHSHFISDLALTNNNNYLLSSSWDKTIRLWDLTVGKCSNTFVENGHEKEALSCSISQDGRMIISSGCDKKIKLWNAKGEMKNETNEKFNHRDWVSKVKFIPTSSKTAGQFFATTSWDGYLKIWSGSNFGIKDSFKAHDGAINAITISPRGNFIVTGGKDKMVRVWDFNDVEKELPFFNAGAPVTCLAFNPRSSLIAIGTEVKWQIWNFEGKEAIPIFELESKMENVKKKEDEKETKKIKNDKFHQVTSISWNTLGSRLFVGYSNGVIRVYDITEEKVAL